jgi:hypothetical protein
MIQKTRRRPRVGMAFRTKEMMRARKRREETISLTALRATPRERSAEAAN